MPEQVDMAAATELLVEQLALRRSETAEHIERRTRGKGYPSKWLTGPVELPGVLGVDPAQLVRLDYERYSVVFDRARRLCRISACGIPAVGDADGAVWIGQGGDTRAAAALDAHLEASGGPVFHADPRLEEALQLRSHWYDAVGKLLERRTPFDQGHMTARSQVAFGRTLEAAVRSQTDSFAFPNVVPQTGRSNEHGDWRHVEQYIDRLRLAGARILHFTGPVLRADDPAIDVPDDPSESVRVPRLFWKIVAAEPHRRARLRVAYAFLLDDSDAVTRVAAAVRAAATDRRPLREAVTDAGPLPAPTVRWSSLHEVARRARLDVGALASFAEPPAEQQRIRTLQDIVAIAPHDARPP